MSSRHGSRRNGADASNMELGRTQPKPFGAFYKDPDVTGALRFGGDLQRRLESSRPARERLVYPLPIIGMSIDIRVVR